MSGGALRSAAALLSATCSSPWRIRPLADRKSDIGRRRAGAKREGVRARAKGEARDYWTTRLRRGFGAASRRTGLRSGAAEIRSQRTQITGQKPDSGEQRELGVKSCDRMAIESIGATCDGLRLKRNGNGTDEHPAAAAHPAPGATGVCLLPPNVHRVPHPGYSHYESADAGPVSAPGRYSCASP